MEYYVIGPDGAKYGPASIDVLNTWIDEGRLIPMTRVETEDGLSLLAADVDGLLFPDVPQYYGQGPAPSYSFPSQVQPTTDAKGDGSNVAIACVLGSIALIIGWVCCPIGIACGIGGIVLSTRAMNSRSSGALAALIFNIVALLLSVFGTFFFQVGSIFFS